MSRFSPSQSPLRQMRRDGCFSPTVPALRGFRGHLAGPAKRHHAGQLSNAQRADHHARRRRILIAKGIVYAGPGGPKKGTNIVSYAKETSRALGVHETTVNLDLARGKNIAPEAWARAGNASNSAKSAGYAFPRENDRPGGCFRKGGVTKLSI